MVAVVALFCALSTAVVADDDLQVNAKLLPELVGIDELVHFSIEVSGSGFGGRGASLHTQCGSPAARTRGGGRGGSERRGGVDRGLTGALRPAGRSLVRAGS